MSNRSALVALIQDGIDNRQTPAQMALRIELTLGLDRGDTFGEVWRDPAQGRLVVDVGDGLIAETGPPPVAPSTDWTLLFVPDRGEVLA